MIELDRISSSTSSSTTSSSTTISTKQKYHTRITKNRRLAGGCGSGSITSSSANGSSVRHISGTAMNHGRMNKPIKIAPAPVATLQPCQKSLSHQIASLNRTSITKSNLSNQVQSTQKQQHTTHIKCNLRNSK